MEASERWKIDMDRSTLTFSLAHAAIGQIKGEFRCWGGEAWTDPVDHQKTNVRIWVELSSLETGSRRRDEAILHTELFDQRWEPALEFDGDRLEIGSSDHMTLVGWLALRSLRKQVSLDLTASTLALDRPGAPRFVCTAKASIDRRSLGLRRPRSVKHWLDDRLLGDTIDVVAHVEATRDLPA
jgi:polyisoprenoid-binding protein YceI